MNWDRIEGNWKKVKGTVREQWGLLSDDHLSASPASATSWSAASRNRKA